MTKALVTNNSENKSKFNDWRQGDYVLAEQDFLFRFNVINPVSNAAKAMGEGSEGIAVQTVSGLVVVSQTCDIVKDPASRQFVEVAPLVNVGEVNFKEIKSGASPRFAVIEALEAQRIVADLDRLMTVEKPVLEQWNRVEGFSSPQALRKFSEALSRKRTRPAFPDDFNEYISPLRTVFKKKAGKDSDEGRALDQVEEIRVISSDWNSEKVKVDFLFFLSKNIISARKIEIEKIVTTWLSKLKPAHAKYSYKHRVNYYSNFSAEEYILGEKLDYDYLSD